MSFGAEMREDVYKHVVVLGMGGSSLAPDVLLRDHVRASTAGYPAIARTGFERSRDQIKTLDRALDIAQTSLFIVAIQKRHHDGTRSLLPLLSTSACKRRSAQEIPRANIS